MVVGSKSQVFHGNADKTAGGLTKSDLFHDSSDGRIKSRAQSQAAKKNPALKAWRDAVAKAGGLKEDHKFKPIKGALLKKAKKIYQKKK